MRFFDEVWSAFRAFLEAYGFSFAVMVIGGFVIAFFVEVAVKGSFKWLQERFKKNEKAIQILDIARIGTIFLVTVILSAVSTKLIYAAQLALPGNNSLALAPFWFGVIYIAQYVFSMKGIKGILKLREENKEKQSDEPKPKKEKKDPLEGLTRYSEKLWTDGNGNYYNKKGQKQ